jgi:hypothetical protein
LLSHLERLRLHVDTLFSSDPTGRLLRAREPDGARAPRFYLGRSPHGNLWRFRDDLSRASLRELSRLAGRERPLGLDLAPPERLAAFRRVLADAGAGGDLLESRGLAYCFPEGDARLATPPGEKCRIVPLSEADARLLEGEFANMISQLSDRQPCFAVMAESRVVSLCCSARALWREKSKLVAAEARVETLPEYRGRGFAPAVISAWAQAVSERGGLPLCSAAWDDAASQAVARRLGLVMYGEDLQWS